MTSLIAFIGSQKARHYPATNRRRANFTIKCCYWTVNVNALLSAVAVVALLRDPELTLALAVTPYDPASDLWFNFTFQLAIPLELVLADWVEVLPFGPTNVNTTLAPAAGKPPLRTLAVTGTVPGREKLDPEIETLIDKAGAATTVAFAVSVVLATELDAVKFTA